VLFSCKCFILIESVNSFSSLGGRVQFLEKREPEDEGNEKCLFFFGRSFLGQLGCHSTKCGDVYTAPVTSIMCICT